MYLRHRLTGKMHRLVPEQFHQEWDILRVGEEYAHMFAYDDWDKEPRIAGRYGTPSNVFQIGYLVRRPPPFFFSLK